MCRNSVTFSKRNLSSSLIEHVMLSDLFSTASYIKGLPYRLCICTGDDSSKGSFSTHSHASARSDTCESKLIDAKIPPSSIRLHFESLSDRNQHSDSVDKDSVPGSIILDHLLNVKVIASLANHNSGLEKKRAEHGNEHSLAKSTNEPSCSSLSQSSGWASAEESKNSNELSISKSTQVHLNYVEITKSFLWTVKRLELEMDVEAADKLSEILTRCLSKLTHRPRHLLCFVNPQCGKGKSSFFSKFHRSLVSGRGPSLYETDVLPLFEEANITAKTIYTERANHARDYINEESLDDYDGLVCVGGDGIFSELCHGLLIKLAQQAKLDIDDPYIKLVRPHLRIGAIPAGSTDALVFGTTGHNDPITSALQIIVGESLLIDVATVGIFISRYQ